MPANGERPDFGKQAVDLEPAIEILRREINILSLQIATLELQRGGLHQNYDTLTHNQGLLRDLAYEVTVRERIKADTMEFPLIRGINDFALRMLQTVSDPLPLAETLSDDVSVVAINDALDIAAPRMVFRVGRHGATSMVLLDQGIVPNESGNTSAVILSIGDGGMRGYNTDYFRRPQGDGSMHLVQNQNNLPPLGFRQLYKPTVERELASFLGEPKYQTALSLVSKRI